MPLWKIISSKDSAYRLLVHVVPRRKLICVFAPKKFAATAHVFGDDHRVVVDGTVSIGRKEVAIVADEAHRQLATPVALDARQASRRGASSEPDGDRLGVGF